MERKILAGCVILENNSILLLRRIKNGTYEMPGGKMDPGETLEETARRELKEEIGCNVHLIHKIGHETFSLGEKEIEYHWFLARLDGQKPIVGEPDVHSEVRYISLDELSNFPISANLQKFLDYWKKNEKLN